MQRGGQGARGLLVRHSHANDVAACAFKVADLGNRGADVARVGLGHGLNNNGSASANGYPTYSERL